MKKSVLLIAILFASSLTQAFGGPRGLPEEIRDRLSEEQIAELEDASSPEARRELLESWGIQWPPPRGDKGRHRGPPPKLDEATQSQLDSLKARYEAATTEEEKEDLREQIHELFRTSRSDDEKKGIRRFFKDHPSRGQDGEAASANAGTR